MTASGCSNCFRLQGNCLGNRLEKVNIDERISSTTRLCDSVQLVLLPYRSEVAERLCRRPATTTSQFVVEFLNLSSTRSWLDAEFLGMQTTTRVQYCAASLQ